MNKTKTFYLIIMGLTGGVLASLLGFFSLVIILESYFGFPNGLYWGLGISFMIGFVGCYLYEREGYKDD